MTTSPHRSDSSEQRSAETIILRALGARIGASLKDAEVLSIGTCPDGIDYDRKVIVEVFARLGPLKAAQRHKLRADVLKLAYFDKELGSGWRKIICVVGQEAAAFLTGQSWTASAARSFEIEVILEPLPEDHEALVRAAQARQRMENGECP